MVKKGKVYLVGAGPGDPGLITAKGLDCIKRADVVVYDHLVDDRLANSAPANAEKIYVGKSATYHTRDQSEINLLLVEKARSGKTVVRLKGGDPFVLGRGGEEAETLAQHKIPFEIVPGITSAVAVPAYAGIPVTYRHLASSLAIVTGHEDPSKETSSINWEKLATGVDSLVILMGMGNLASIIEQLISNGRSASTPVALIQQGTSHEQQTLVGDLDSIVAKSIERNLKPPVVMVIGEVVRLREKLRWFDNRPLFGKRVLVTRARHQASRLSQLLQESGAMPVEMPVIDIQPTQDTDKLDSAILGLEQYNWIIFTSSNGVNVFFQRLELLNLDARWLKNIKVCAIGPATTEALKTHGIYADYLPAEYTSDGIIRVLEKQDIAGCRILLPRADIADKELSKAIVQLGAEVHEVVAYKTTLPAEEASAGKQMLLEEKIDIITFTSSSTVVNLLKQMDGKQHVVNKATIACIGPKTAARAFESGIRVDIVARESTIPGLVEAIKQYFQTDVEEVK